MRVKASFALTADLQIKNFQFVDQKSSEDLCERIKAKNKKTRKFLVLANLKFKI